MGLNVVNYALSNHYTDLSLEGLGSQVVKGAPCEVASVVTTDLGTTVTLKWTGTSGTVQTEDFFVKNGEKGEKGDKGDPITVDEVIAIGPTPPEAGSTQRLWVDTSETEKKLKYWNEDTSSWDIVTVVESESPSDLEIINKNIHLIDQNGNKIGSGVLIATEEFKTQVVTELPTENISSSTIYMMASEDAETDDEYEEYVYTNGKWEKLGNLDTPDEVLKKSEASSSEISDLFNK